MKIRCEAFELTDSIKAAFSESEDYVNHYLPKEYDLEFSVHKDAKHSYDITIQVHVGHKQFVVHAKNDDFYLGLKSAREKMGKVLLKNKQKKIHKRKHPKPILAKKLDEFEPA